MDWALQRRPDWQAALTGAAGSLAYHEINNGYPYTRSIARAAAQATANAAFDAARRGVAYITPPQSSREDRFRAIQERRQAQRQAQQTSRRNHPAITRPLAPHPPHAPRPTTMKSFRGGKRGGGGGRRKYRRKRGGPSNKRIAAVCRRTMSKLVGETSMEMCGTSSCLSTTGTQGYRGIATASAAIPFLSTDDINRCFVTSAQSSGSLPSGLNPNKHIKISLLKSSLDVEYTNQGSTQIWVTWYKCRTTEDGSDLEPAISWVNGLANQFESTNSSVALFATTIGATPFKSGLFCSKYHVLSVRKYLLQPGEFRRFRMKGGRKTVNRQDLYDAANALQERKGTYIFFPVVYGTTSSIANPTANTDITIGPAQILCTWVKKFKWEVYQSDKTITQVYGGTNFGTTGSLVQVNPHNPSGTGVAIDPIV